MRFRSAISSSLLIIAFSSRVAAAVETEASVRLGGVGVRHHHVQFGKDGSKFNYREEGGQDIIFPFSRFMVTLKTESDARIELQYVPIDIETESVLQRDITIDGASFPLGTNMKLRYSFPFYRVGYSVRIGDGANPLHLGAALQIRNASIRFAAADGSLMRVNQNVGPVPLFTAAWHCASCEIPVFTRLATFYAPVKYLNGSDSDVVGAFTDFELGWRGATSDPRPTNFIASAGYLGGGARGTSTRNKGFSDGFSANWLDLVFFSLGLDRAI